MDLSEFLQTFALPIVLALISAAALGGTGIAAYRRANGQNLVDMYTAQNARIAVLEDTIRALDERNDGLILEKADLLGRINALTHRNEQIAQEMGRQSQQIEHLRAQIARVTALEGENAQLREETAQLKQRLQIETSRRELLQRDFDEFRLKVSAASNGMQPI